MKDYKKYKWFYTSTGKLVVGGKNAEQNDELLSRIKKSKQNYIVMHTSHPGSPFAVIIADPKKVTRADIGECAIFTGCFSRAWKQGRSSTSVHRFRSNQLSKLKGMKTGMWLVKGRVVNMKVALKLVLTKQKNTYRSVPEKSTKKALLRLSPGKKLKEDMLDKLKELLKDKKVKDDELLAALPAGGVSVRDD